MYRSPLRAHTECDIRHATSRLRESNRASQAIWVQLFLPPLVVGSGRLTKMDTHTIATISERPFNYGC